LRVVHRFAWVVAAGPEQIAWRRVGCPNCPGWRGRLHLFKVATGTSITTAVPSTVRGIMTDDGAWLAVQLSGQFGGPGSLAVVNTSTGAATVIPGTNLGYPPAPGLNGGPEWMHYG
jgi:hypothetical protein